MANVDPGDDSQTDCSIRREADRQLKEKRYTYIMQAFPVWTLSCVIVFGVLAGIIGDLFGFDGTFKLGAIPGIAVAWVIAIKLANRKFGKEQRSP
jgi:hypothetical protein